MSVLARLRKCVDFLRSLPRGKRAPGAGEERHPWEAAYPEGVSWRLDVEPRPLFTILDDAAATYPDKPCLQFFGRRYTYREVRSLAARAAKGFQDLGVKRGVRVGLFLPNSPYFVICYYGILKAGGTVVNFNPLCAEREVTHQIRDSETSIMVTINLKGLYPKIRDRLADTCLQKIVVCHMRSALPFPESAIFAILKRKDTTATPSDERHVTFEELTANDGAFDPVSVDPARDIAVLQYTGGTTGSPKGAMLTHGNLYTNTIQIRTMATAIRPGEEKILAVLPLFHVFGMTAVMNLGLNIGAELILLPQFKVADVLKAIGKEHPSILMGVPTIYSAINGHRDCDQYDLSSLKFCISGGAPLPAEIKDRFERLTGCTLVEGYGLTEASPVCTINPFGGLNKPGSIGLPLPGTFIEIVSLDNPRKTVPPGERGEICICGPQVMAGYWNRADETATALRGGRLRTGDIGYMDKEGFVFVIDRLKDLIISGGFNVYPRVVEEAILLHPAVEEVAVCGVPDRHRGEIVKAYVKLRDGVSLPAPELREFLKDKLSPYEMPGEIETRNEIPKTLIGKPSRRELIAEELQRMKHCG